MNDILAGQTEVRVLRRTVNEQNGRESIQEIHKGMVVQNLGSHVRVFNPAPPDKGGDIHQTCSEVFAKRGKNLWLEPISQRSENDKFPIACELRF